ncbi:MAG: right-handed parallel beta-helix repeat-containing protein [Spirochaetales bacterium]|nr:right-handed parallel beta-helix repeat-containing protein [Spirochaetales bacterium]
MKIRIASILFCILLMGSGCTLILTDEVDGTGTEDGGVLAPMLDILEEELKESYDSSLSIIEEPAVEAVSDSRSHTRTLAGGANSIRHGLPLEKVTLVAGQVGERVRNLGLGRSRDIAKVAPAVAEATVEALLNDSLVGTGVTKSALINIHAVSIRAVARAISSPAVAAVAEGLNTPEEQTEQLRVFLEAAGESLDDFEFSADETVDSVQKIVISVTEEGNGDLSDPSSTDDVALMTERMNLILNLASDKMDDASQFPGADCADALNGLANAAVLALGGTSFSGAGAADLQAVVRDGIMTGLFLAYYGFSEDVGLSSADLQAALDFTESLNLLEGLYSDYYDSVAANIQAVRQTELIPEAVAAARAAYIISSPDGGYGSLVDSAVPATAVPLGESIQWTAGSEIFVGTSLSINGVLTIGPGSIIYLGVGASINISNTGTLRALGTAEAPIVFTRAYSNPWGAINIASLDNTLSWCDITGGTNGVVVTGKADVDHSRFHGHQTNGGDLDSAVADVNALSTITDSWFYGNGDYAVRINQNVLLDDTNHFYDPENEAAPDLATMKNAVLFYGNIDARPVNMTITEVPYVIYDGSTVEIQSAGRLTVGPGCILKFAPNSYYPQVRTRIEALGTADAPIYFTSLTNSDIGGDTDGSGTSGTPGDWNGLDIQGAGSRFIYCEFSYAENGLDFNDWTVDSGTAEVSHCQFHNNSGFGFEGTEAQIGSTVTDSWFWDNGSYPASINEVVVFDETNHFYDPDSGATEPDLAVGIEKQAIYFEGDVNTNLTFSITEVPYYIADSNFDVNISGKLTLAPGLILKFSAGNLSTRIFSQIDAVGTASSPIIFTSITNSEVGGDTDGVEDAGTPGDWTGLDIIGAGSRFEYCEFSYAVAGVDFNDWTNDQGQAVFDHCWFHHNENNGFEGTEAMEGTVVSNSAFWDNGLWPVVINDDVSLDATNTFIEPGTTGEPDISRPYQAIRFNGDIESEVTFDITAIPYVLADTQVDIIAPGTLNVEPGVTVKANCDAGDVRVFSRITAVGTETLPIIFTAYTNSLIGGDTDGVGDGAVAGDWYGFDIIGTGSVFTYCEISYGRRGIDLNDWTIDSGSALINNCTISDSLSSGIDASQASAGTEINNCTFSGNGASDIYINGNTVNVSWTGNTGAVITE